MCYAIPAKILQLSGESALVDYGGIRKSINVSLLDHVNIGEFVLIHAGFAIQKVDKNIAQQSLKAWEGLNATK